MGRIRYLGEEVILYKRADASSKKIVIAKEQGLIVCRVPCSGQIDATKALKKFYQKECRRIVNEKVKLYQPHFKDKVKSVTIESSNVRWGSCNSNRELTFHWQLVLFPIGGLDYVVVHEMCHMAHLNHDRSFWRLVGKHCPNYKEAMKIIGSEKTRGV